MPGLPSGSVSADLSIKRLGTLYIQSNNPLLAVFPPNNGLTAYLPRPFAILALSVLTTPTLKPAGKTPAARSGSTTACSCKTSATCWKYPAPTTYDPTQDSYVLERAVQFNDGLKKSTGRIDCYKRGCFVLETKQGTDTADQQKKQERADLGPEPSKRRKGHAVRGSAKWAEMMQAARQQDMGYVRALPAEEPRPLFVLVADVGYCIDVYSNFAGNRNLVCALPRPDPVPVAAGRAGR